MIDRLRELLSRPVSPVWRDRIVLGAIVVAVVLIVGYAAAQIFGGSDGSPPKRRPVSAAPVKKPRARPKALPGIDQVSAEFSRDYLAYERGKVKPSQIRHAAVELAVRLERPRCTPATCPPKLVRDRAGHVKLLLTTEGNGATVGYWFWSESGTGKKRHRAQERGTLLLTLRRDVDRGWEVVRLGY